jgi:hypothetical protein
MVPAGAPVALTHSFCLGHRNLRLNAWASGAVNNLGGGLLNDLAAQTTQLVDTHMHVVALSVAESPVTAVPGDTKPLCCVKYLLRGPSQPTGCCCYCCCRYCRRWLLPQLRNEEA